MMGFAIYIAALAAVTSLLPASALDPESKKFVLLLGGLGIWRYSWAGLHFLRSVYYRHWVFPGWRARGAQAARRRLARSSLFAGDELSDRRRVDDTRLSCRHSRGFEVRSARDGRRVNRRGGR